MKKGVAPKWRVAFALQFAIELPAVIGPADRIGIAIRKGIAISVGITAIGIETA